MPESRATLIAALHATENRVGASRPAVTDSSGTLTYGALVDAVVRLAYRLEQTTPVGETIGLIDLPGSQLLQLLLGAALAGRTVALLPIKASRRALATACATAKVGRILCPRESLRRVTSALRSPAALEVAWPIHAVEDLLRPSNVIERIQARWRSRHLERATESITQGVAITFSLDRAARVQGALFTQRNLLAGVRQVQTRQRWSADDIVLCTLPPHQPATLVAGLLAPVLSGVHAVLVKHARGVRLVTRLVRELEATRLIATPVYLRHYARVAGQRDLSSLRSILSIGEPLATPMASDLAERFGIPVQRSFSSAGVAGFVALAHTTSSGFDAAMRLTRGTRVRLVATPNRTQRGVLHVSGPQVARHRISERAPGVPLPIRSAIGSGWLETGETFDVLPDRCVLWLAGRGTHMHVGGETIPAAIAERLAGGASPDAVHAAVINLNGARQALTLFTTDPTLRRKRLLDLADALGEPRVAVPRQIRYLRTLPRRADGGIDYGLLGRYANAATGSTGAPAEPIFSEVDHSSLSIGS